MVSEVPTGLCELDASTSQGIDAELLEAAAADCGCLVDQIEDILPCTPLQEGLIALTAKNSTAYVSHMIYQLRSDVDVVRLQKTVGAVYSAVPLLRARIVDLSGAGMVQVYVREDYPWTSYPTLDICLSTHKQQTFSLGKPLSAFSIVRDESSGRDVLVVSLHHAVYDGYSLKLILKLLERDYKHDNANLEPLVPFQNFVEHILQIDDESARSFWSMQLAESEAPSFPALPKSSESPAADHFMELNFDNIAWAKSDFTPTTLIRAAWSILAAKYTNSCEAIFGVTTSGRQANVPGIESIAGPTLATVPMRVKVEWTHFLDSWMKSVQQQAIDMTAFEQVGLQNIRTMGPELAAASNFQTLLVVQPKVDNGDVLGPPFLPDGPEVPEESYVQGLKNFNSYALLLECCLRSTGFHVRASFDERAVSVSQLSRMLRQLGHVVQQLCNGADRVSDVSLVPPHDLKDIWQWNFEVPERVDKCVHNLIIETCLEHPTNVAVDAWDGSWTYAELNDMSCSFAAALSSLGVGPGVLVPLCFEKSKWMPVAMLGVARTGAASAAMDPTQPKDRLRKITHQTEGPILISSESNAELMRQLTARRIVVLGDGFMSTLCAIPLAVAARPAVRPSDPLCIVFTSGSTGQPKGSIITHANFCTALRHHQRFLQISPTSRTYDFSSYAFDATWSNMFHTFASGGCVCIPHDDRRRNDLESSIAESKSTFVFMTPSIARALDPSRLHCLETIIIGGETIVQEDISRWSAYSRTVVAYGPTEATIYSSFTSEFFTQGSEASIGKGCGLNTWVVDPDDPLMLAPIGAIGELLLEGPLLAPGYLNNEHKSAESFLVNPPWLTAGGRTGRLYKTGDLVRYTDDGTLVIIGRKDTQVKIRGQRVELSDIEHHIRQHLLGTKFASVAEVITPKGSKTPMLVAFFGVSMAPDQPLLKAMEEVTRGLEKVLLSKIPVYMVPAAYVPLFGRIPMTSTGKIDRKTLREMGSQWTREQIAEFSSSQQVLHKPETEPERQLQKLWSNTLGIELALVYRESHFFRTGGDSISAMRLVNTAQAMGISLTVADIFKYPQLSDLATILTSIGAPASNVYTPFSTVVSEAMTLQHVQDRASAKLKPHSGHLEDVFPVTAVQAQYIRMALKTPPQQWNYFYVDLEAEMPDTTIMQVCQAIWNELDALRLVFVANGEHYHQLVLGHNKPNMTFYTMDKDLDTIVQHSVGKDLDISPELGSSFTNFFVLRNHTNQVRLMIRMSHAQYDGVGMETFSRVLAAAVANRATPETPPFALYVDHCITATTAACQYWTDVLLGSRLARLPKRQEYGSSQPSSGTVRLKAISPALVPVPGTTAAAAFLARCFGVLNRLCGADDAVIGVLVSGRAMLPPHLKDVFGPCLNTIPLRILSKAQEPSERVCHRVHDILARSMPFETMGIEDIAPRCTTWADQSPGIVVQYQNIDEQPQPHAQGVLSRLQFVEREPYIEDERVFVLARPKADGLWLEVAAKAGVYDEKLLQTFLDGLKNDFSQSET